MKKKGYKSKKAQQKRRETIFFGVLLGLLILVAVLGIVDFVTGNDSGYTVTADGHVHAADGTHIGTIEEIFGEAGADVVVTEDGHVHTADGTHLGSFDEIILEGEGHEHTEGEESDHAEDEAE